MESSGYQFFVGVDWATEKHDISVVDRIGTKILERIFENSVNGLNAMAEALTALSPHHSQAVAVTIEIPHGPIVEMLVDRGFHVYAINPKQLDRFRDRHTTIGAKDDRLDAYVLADSGRTDLHCFRLVKLADADTVKLRSLSRIRDDVGETLRRLSNQLREQLLRYVPHYLGLCQAADKPWFWELLEMAADPADAAAVKKYKVQKLLIARRIRKYGADEIMATLKAPPFNVAPGVIDSVVFHIKVLLAQLKVVNEQATNIDKQIQETLGGLTTPLKEGEHRDAAILLSLPGVGNVVAATMLSEASQAIAERDYETLRAQAGVAPVTKRSGKRLNVGMRYACNNRLREAAYHWSRTSVIHDSLSREKYKAMRAKGHSHPRALRSIADGLLRVFIGMLKSSSTFEPSRRKAA